MVPPKTDPRWRKLVTAKVKPPVTGFVTKMLFSRVAVLCTRNDEGSIQEAIQILHEYFSKNEVAAAGDLKLALS
jgi:hypothetical protein